MVGSFLSALVALGPWVWVIAPMVLAAAAIVVGAVIQAFHN